MAKRIEEIFEECLERIEHGESIESCLSSYPDESQELEDMLRTFVNVKWRTTLVEANPQYKNWGKAQLFNIYAKRAYQAEKEASRPGIFSLQRMWIPALAGLLIFVLLGGVGTAAASNSAMPDQPLYPVKLATEEVRLALSFSDVDKAVVNTEIAQRRAQEIAAMAEIGKTEYVVTTTERMLNNLENAEQAVNNVVSSQTPVQPTVLTPEPTQPAATTNMTEPDNGTQQENTSSTSDTNTKNQRVQESYEKTVEENLAVLEDTLNKVPESAKQTIQNALEITRTKKERIESRTNTKFIDRNHNDIPDKDEIKRPGSSLDNNTSPVENQTGNNSENNTIYTDNSTGTQQNTTTNNTAASNNTSTIVKPGTNSKTSNSGNVTSTTPNNTTTSSDTTATTTRTTTNTSNSTGTTANTTASSANATSINKTGAVSTNSDSNTSTNIWKFWHWRIFRH
jgi:hypothetical protein